MTIPKNAITEMNNLLRIAKAFSFGKFLLCFIQDEGSGQHYQVDNHCQFALKQLRVSALNEMHTNSYTGHTLTGAVYSRTFRHANSGNAKCNTRCNKNNVKFRLGICVL